jgi:alpha-mannosidase
VKTVDEYYSGFEGRTSNARVQLILDIVVEQL